MAEGGGGGGGGTLGQGGCGGKIKGENLQTIIAQVGELFDARGSCLHRNLKHSVRNRQI